MAAYNDNIRVKLLDNKTEVSLSIRESETKVSTYILPRKDFEKMINDYNTFALYNPETRSESDMVILDKEE